MMKEEGIPLTRENYLQLVFGDHLPQELSAEQEADLPEVFQRHHLGRAPALQARKSD
jgi:hypothetical protein